MSRTPPSETAIRVADLSQNAKHAFLLVPDTGELSEIATGLELISLKKLRFEGDLIPIGKSDWQLKARLGATVVQACVVTLEPVMTRIDTVVTRQFVRNFDEPDESEVEMNEDETVEPLGTWIDPAVVMHEALTLAIPDYPRIESAEAGDLVFAEPGSAPMTDADARPFAGLADLKAQLKTKEE